MGLLDNLLTGQDFGGQNGGLLDMLRNMTQQQSQYQPSQGFPDQPASFADRFSAMPGAPAAYQPAPQSVSPANYDPNTFAPNQAQPISVGDYQMPRIGGAPQFAPAPQAAIPQNAQPTQGQLPPQAQAPMQPEAQQPLPPAFGGSGYLDRLNNGGGLIGSMLGDTTQQKNLKAQYDALVPILGQQKALLAVMNPEAGKTLINEALTNKEKYGVISENPVEGKKYGFINEREQTIDGKPIGQSGGQSSPGGLLAQGAIYDPNRSGDDYLNQFSPEVKAAVKSYMNGDVVPAGNPRQQAIAAQAKTIAQKYGQDMGIPVSDTLYAEKRKYRTELGTNSPNSAGGQAKAFNQGIFHMAGLAPLLEKLDNSNGLGIPIIAKGVNATRQALSNETSAISDEAKSIGQTIAGEVGKLFSGSAGGGVHERELTRERFDTIKSKPQLAAALRGTLETMDGGLKALEQRRDAVLGPNSGVDLVTDETKKNIAKVQGAIDRLEGKSAAAPGPDRSAVEAEMRRRGLLK